MTSLSLSPDDSSRSTSTWPAFVPAVTARRTRRRHSALIPLVLLLAGVVAKPADLPAQALQYERTTFLHGFGSHPSIWTTPYSGLSGLPTPGYLAQTIDLGTAGLVSLDTSKNYAEQRVILRDTLALQQQRHVLVGHSLGSLVGRGTYLGYADRRPNIVGILAVTPIFQGAPIAGNLDEAADFLADVEWRVNGGIDAVNMIAGIIDLFLSLVTRMPFMAVSAIASVFIPESGNIDVDDFAALASLRVLPDMVPGSPAIVEQNSRFEDASIVRANVTGSIPFSAALLRLQASAMNNEAKFEDLKRERNQAMSLFGACRIGGYILFPLYFQARACSNARKALGRMDSQWVKYVNGTGAYGLPLMVPFDGVVPNDHQQYPGLSDPLLKFHVDSGNHQNVLKVRRGADMIVQAMQAMRMRNASGGGEPATLTASISGPNSIPSEGSYTWIADVAGGTGSYSYQWEISYDGGGAWWNVGSGASHNEPYISGTESFELRVTVTSGTQTATSDFFYVFVNTTCGGYIC